MRLNPSWPPWSRLQRKQAPAEAGACLRSVHREAQCQAGLSRWPGIAQPRNAPRPGLAGAQVGHRPLNTGLRPETAACLGHRPRDRPCLRPARNGTDRPRRGQQRRDGDGGSARACQSHPRAGGETAGTGRSRCLSRSAHREAQCQAGLSRRPGIAQPRNAPRSG